MKLVVTLAFIPAFSPPSSLRYDAIAPKPKAKADGEKEQRSHRSGFADNRPANPVAGFRVRRQVILPLCPSPSGWERVAAGRVRD